MTYHISPNGPSKCRAKQGKCPYGADGADHYENVNEALMVYEKRMTETFGGFEGVKRTVAQKRTIKVYQTSDKLRGYAKKVSNSAPVVASYYAASKAFNKAGALAHKVRHDRGALLKSFGVGLGKAFEKAIDLTARIKVSFEQRTEYYRASARAAEAENRELWLRHKASLEAAQAAQVAQETTATEQAAEAPRKKASVMFRESYNRMSDSLYGAVQQRKHKLYSFANKARARANATLRAATDRIQVAGELQKQSFNALFGSRSNSSKAINARQIKNLQKARQAIATA